MRVRAAGAWLVSAGRRRGAESLRHLLQTRVLCGCLLRRSPGGLRLVRGRLRRVRDAGWALGCDIGRERRVHVVSVPRLALAGERRVVRTRSEECASGGATVRDALGEWS